MYDLEELVEDLRQKEQELSAELEAADQAFEDMRGSHGQLVDALRDVSGPVDSTDFRNSPITRRKSSNCEKCTTRLEKSSTSTDEKWICLLSKTQIMKPGTGRMLKRTVGSLRRESR